METKRQYFVECNIPTKNRSIIKEEPKSRWEPQPGTYNSYAEAVEAAHNANIFPYRIKWVNANV